MPNLAELLKEGLALKTEIAQRQNRLHEINRVLADAAEYKPGSSTGRVAAGGILARVTRRQNTKWDQAALSAACQKIGAPLFKKAFTYEFKPIDARTLRAWLSSDDTPDEAKQLIEAARTITDGLPSVTYEVADAD